MKHGALKHFEFARLWVGGWGEGLGVWVVAAESVSWA